MADDTSPLRTQVDFERLLRSRLRVIAALTSVATGSIALVTMIVRWRGLANAFTQPPLPGVLALISIAAVACFAFLSPRLPRSLRELRVVEWSGVGMIAVFFLINQSRAMRGLLPDFLGTPMEFGVAMSAPWGILAITYAVLVPSDSRRTLIRTVSIAAMAFVVDVIAMTGTFGIDGAASYFALKIIVLGVMSALALYGAYRIETLGQQAEIASELGQYLLRRSLGEGGMGSVFLAEHRFLRRPCAVKLIRAEQANDEVAVARFEREVQSAASLTHPNTVQIYDYGRSDDGTFYFAMEFLPGVTLEELVKQHGPMPASRAVHVLSQICGALNEAHERGLVHRDLKPGNVMLCERGGVADVAKLLDFGLVAAVNAAGEADSHITRPGMVVGTPAYMSPEQCTGSESVTASSDIYSLGALGYFLLTGQPPFAGRSPMQTIASHVMEKPKRMQDVRPDVPEPVSAVLARCLEKKPGDRYADVLAVQRALEDSIAGMRWTGEHARDWWRATQSAAP